MQMSHLSHKKHIHPYIENIHQIYHTFLTRDARVSVY